MGVNMAVLGDRTITPLVKHAHTAHTAHTSPTTTTGESLDALLAEVKQIAEEGFSEAFWAAYREAIRTKLGTLSSPSLV